VYSLRLSKVTIIMDIIGYNKQIIKFPEERLGGEEN